MMRRLRFPLSILIAVVWAGIALAHVGGNRINPDDYPHTFSTDQYEVVMDEKPSNPTALLQALETLYRDFDETFRSRIRMKPTTKKLPMVLSYQPVHYELNGALVAQAGFYDPRIQTGFVHVGKQQTKVDQRMSTLRHEAAHQLFDVRLRIPVIAADDHFWYREGLACYFEGTGAFRLNGTVRISRLGMLEQLLEHRSIPPLKELLTIERDLRGHPISYALAWSFCHFLMHGDNGAYRDRLIGFLSNLQDWNQRGRNQFFEQVIGEPEALQTLWVRHIVTLIESNDSELKTYLAPIGSSKHQARTELEKTMLPTLNLPQAVGSSGTHVSWATCQEIGKQLFRTKLTIGPAKQAQLEAIRAENPSLPHIIMRLYQGIDQEETRLHLIEIIEDLKIRNALGLLIGSSLKGSSETLRKRAAKAVGILNYSIAPPSYYTRLRNSASVKEWIRNIEALEQIKDPFSERYIRYAMSRANKISAPKPKVIQPSFGFGGARGNSGTIGTRVAPGIRDKATPQYSETDHLMLIGQRALDALNP